MTKHPYPLPENLSLASHPIAVMEDTIPAFMVGQTNASLKKANFAGRMNSPIFILLSQLKNLDLPHLQTAENYSNTFGGQLFAHRQDLNISEEQVAVQARKIINAQLAISPDTVKAWKTNDEVVRDTDVMAVLKDILINQNRRIYKEEKAPKLAEIDNAALELSRYMIGRGPANSAFGRLITRYCDEINITDHDLALQIRDRLYVMPKEKPEEVTEKLIGLIQANLVTFSPGLADILITTLDSFGTKSGKHALSENDRRLMAELYQNQMLQGAANTPIAISITPIDVLPEITAVSEPVETPVSPAEIRQSKSKNKPEEKETKSKAVTVASLRAEIGRMFRFKREKKPLSVGEVVKLTGALVSNDEVKNYTRPQAERLVLKSQRQVRVRKELSKVLESLEYSPGTINLFVRKFDILNQKFKAESVLSVDSTFGKRSVRKGKELSL